MRTEIENNNWCFLHLGEGIRVLVVSRWSWNWISSIFLVHFRLLLIWCPQSHRRYLLLAQIWWFVDQKGNKLPLVARRIHILIQPCTVVKITERFPTYFAQLLQVCTVSWSTITEVQGTKEEQLQNKAICWAQECACMACRNGTLELTKGTRFCSPHLKKAERAIDSRKLWQTRSLKIFRWCGFASDCHAVCPLSQLLKINIHCGTSTLDDSALVDVLSIHSGCSLRHSALIFLK